MADQQPTSLTPQQERLLAEGLVALARGWNVTPLNGKKPMLTGWPKLAPPSPETARRWVEQGHNLGLVTGAGSNIDVIDDDTRGGAAEAMLGLPPTPTVRTGSGKRHHYFQHVEGINNSVSKIADGIDIRTEGGQVVLPGSKHPETGEEYRWEEGRSPNDLPVAPMPTALVERIKASKRPKPRRSKRDAWAAKALAAETSRVAAATEGTRNDTLNAAAFNLGQICAGGSLPEHDVADGLLNAAKTAGLPESEAIATIESGMRAGALEPRTPKNETPIGEESLPKHEPLTDTGNAERLVKLAKGNLRFCYDWKKWMHWDGRRWLIDASGAAMRLSKKVARSFYDLAANAGTAQISNAYAEFAKKTEKVDRRKAMTELAKSEEGIPLTPMQMDQHPMLLNCSNGTLDLATLELRPHRREDYLTKLCPTAYKPDAQCPLFQAFLARVLPDPELQGYMQRFFGLSLTGDISEQSLQIAVGDGLNGKSTLYCALLDVLGGGYAIQVSTEMLLATDRDNHPTELADLCGARLAIGTETPNGRSLNESRVKLLTGGEPIRARRMREDFWQFVPTHKLVIVTNFMPKVSLDSFAMVRRLHVLPFDVRLRPDEIDKRLPQKLRTEREGMLAWGVQGLRELRDRGLDPPTSVLLSQTAKGTSGLRPVAEFITAHVVRKPGMRTPASSALVAFTQWCEREGKVAASQTELGTALGHEGFGKQKSGGVLVYLDMALEGLGSPTQGRLGIVGDGCPVESPCTPHGELNGETVPKCPQPSPRTDPCRICAGTTMWQRSAATDLFCIRCHPPLPGVPVHQVINTATGEVVRNA